MPSPPNITAELVENLVADQFPQWSNLPVTEVVPNGWDNRTYRLGNSMSVRLPSAQRYTAQVQKEHRWLPELAPQLPQPIPTPIALGEPSKNFLWNWSVYGWIEGETATSENVADMPRFANDLADFLAALQSIDTENAPRPGDHNFHRGGDLSIYDDQTRKAISILKSELDTDPVTEVWEVALESSWQNPPVWVHGDISQGNLLVRNGKLSGVIDFGGMCVGDPACDLAISWTLFDDQARTAFRSSLPLDEATWARGRGWTLWKALIIASGISETNAIEAATALQTIEQILNDHPKPTSP